MFGENSSESMPYDVLSEAGLRMSMLCSRQLNLVAGDTAEVWLVVYLSHEGDSCTGRF